MDINSYDPSRDARRFEEGTPPIPSVYAAIAGLRLLLEVGLENSWHHTLSFHQDLRARLGSLSLKIVTPKMAGAHGAMLAIETSDEQAAVASLEHEGVVTSSRAGNLRISPHFYNSTDDLERLVCAVAKHRHLFT
jgi:selenocysteine lyase/cysteine desulfurase